MAVTGKRMNKKEIIIIGSGLGGLVCAHVLASEGYQVKILERESQPGGCMQSYRRQGLDFDTGFHYIGGLNEGEPMHRVFGMLGLLKLPWVRLDIDCFDRIHIAGKSFDLAQGRHNYVDHLSECFPSERQALTDLVKVLSESTEHQLDALRPGMESEGINILPPAFANPMSTSAWEYLKRTFHDELLIDVISGNAIRTELRKDTLPLFTLAHINSSFVKSSWRLRGSGNMIVKSLLDDIQANGGEILCNAEVKRLVEEDGKIVAAECADGSRYEAGIFISDAHPAVTYDMITDSKLIRPVLRHRIERMQNTYGILTVSLVIKEGTLLYRNHNDYIYARPNLWDGFETDEPVSGVMVSYRVPEDGSQYVRQIDLLTPVRWEACSQWSGTRIGHRGEAYECWKQRKADECINLAETVVSGLQAAIEARYISSPITYRDYTLTPQGSAYGLRKDCGNAMLTVLSPRTPEPNLLITGQSLMLHGVEGVTITALLTCAEVVGRKRIWEKIEAVKNNKE